MPDDDKMTRRDVDSEAKMPMPRQDVDSETKMPMPRQDVDSETGQDDKMSIPRRYDVDAETRWFRCRDEITDARRYDTDAEMIQIDSEMKPQMSSNFKAQNDRMAER